MVENDQVVLNTWFRHQKWHLWIWNSPGDLARNQIDYITINKRFWNSVTQARTYPGADVNSDYVPLVAWIKLKQKKIARPKNQVKHEVGVLGRNQEITQKYAIEVWNRFDH